MKAILYIICLTSFFANVFATVPDTADKILILYKLSPAQEAQFNDHDSVVSAFWASWEANTSLNIKLDFINMASDNPAHAWNRCVASPFSGEDDAQMIVRGAYSDKGAYFYFDVVDDQFVEPTGWLSDAVEIFIDVASSQNIMDPMWCGSCMPLYNGMVTFGTKQLQLCMGYQQEPTVFNYRFYNDLAMGIYDHTVSFSDSAYDFITMEITKTAKTRKIQEWFIPWPQISPVNGLTPGSQCAFSCGYNDVDSTGQCLNSLRWQGLCDPYCEPPQGVAVWGDVELGPCLDTNGCSNAARNPLYLSSKIPKANSRQYDLFTLKGEHVAPSIKHLNNRILIRHKIGKDGTRNSLIDPVKAK